MTEAYEGTTGPDYDELLDTIAAVCADDAPLAVAAPYQRKELQVPPGLIR